METEGACGYVIVSKEDDKGKRKRPEMWEEMNERKKKNVTTPSPMTPYSLNSAHVTLLSGEGGGVTSQAPLFRNPLIIPFYRPA